MKSYRIQARINGIYLNGTCKGPTKDDAFVDFLNKIKSGEVKLQKETFYGKDVVLVTYEEIESGDTSVAISPFQKDALGVQVESVVSGE